MNKFQAHIHDGKSRILVADFLFLVILILSSDVTSISNDCSAVVVIGEGNSESKSIYSSFTALANVFASIAGVSIFVV